MPLKLLAVGDMHLGRRPSRLPGELAEQGRQLGPIGAWERVVRSAIEANVDVLALAGDVVERENDFFEAYRELEAGVARLADAGISVVGVVGNHDVAVLPRLAEQIPAFHLLGRDGQWEPFTVNARGEQLTLWGWSFPQRVVRNSPLANMQFTPKAGLNLGLLHCDRDQAGSHYAPVSSRELQTAGLDGWLLGHIHKPDALGAPTPSGYLGSVTGLDPGEPGIRGPWLLEVAQGRVQDIRQWPLAPLRWEALTLDLTDIPEPESARDSLLERLRAFDQKLQAEAWQPDAVGLRLCLKGRSRHGEAVLKLFSNEDREHIYRGEAGRHYFIERLILATQPEIDLEQLAERRDPTGPLARRLRLLDRSADDPQRRALLDRARASLERQAREGRWAELPAAPLDDADCAQWLRESGLRLLEQMLAQQENTA